MTDPSPARVAADRGRTERREADENARRRAQGAAVAVETVPPVPAPTPDGQTGTQGRATRYVLDRDCALWVTAGAASWKCLTTDSCLVAGADLVNVCGPLVELRPVHEVRAEAMAEAFEALTAVGLMNRCAP